MTLRWPHSFRAAKRFAIYARDAFRCVYCYSAQELGLDHVIPRSRFVPGVTLRGPRGEKVTLESVNDPRNVVTCCADCNDAKGARMAHEWTLSLPAGNARRVGAIRRGKVPIDLELGKRIAAVAPKGSSLVFAPRTITPEMLRLAGA